MLKLPKTLLSMVALGSLVLHGGVQAEESIVTLKLAHFLPAHSVTQAQFLKPWAERITEQSNGRIQFQFYPSMQLGGTPPQLVDQVRDGIADIVWTLPGYSSGRFPLTAAFELPFMSSSSEASSQAMWDFIEKHGQKEFADMHLLATHLTDGALVHTTDKPIYSLKDFRGQKLRAANRTAAKTIGLLGATPVAMPVPQVPEALSKGVVDGAVLPWDVVPALKLHELVKYHTETAAGMPALMHTALIVGMNSDTYEKLPDDLKQIIDANSGRELSRQAGQIWDNQVVETGHKLAQSRQNEVYVLPQEEQAKWMKVTSRVSDDWIKDVESKGYENGEALLEEARQLIEQYNAQLTR